MTTNALNNIKHIVVLMLENRSFDHMLGGMPGVNGVGAGIVNAAGAVATTGTASIGGTSLAVASAGGIVPGQLVSGVGIAPNTFVANVSGTTVTISQATTAPLSSTPVIFYAATTGTAGSGDTILIVASASGVASGQLVTGPGIAPCTFVANISGTTVTLSQATTAALNATPVGFFDAFNLSNPTDPTDPGSAAYIQTPIPVGFEPTGFNPYHDLSDMIKQMFGPNAIGFRDDKPVLSNSAATTPKSQSGYVNDYGNAEVMNYFADGQLQVLQTLAKNFVVCDNWFCDVPAFTQPNRLFMHAATAQGILSSGMPPPGYIDARTIFEQIDQNLKGNYPPDRKWKMYYFPPDERDSAYFTYTRNDPRGQATVDSDFLTDVSNGTLPFYSFLMPVLNTCKSTQCNSMHPDADVRYGENYLARVYNSLFATLPDGTHASQHWNDTLLIVTYDENGAIYDHAAPPVTQRPDGIPGRGENFDFTSLGPRIPAILISPWLGAGVDHTQYQNTSILRFIQDMLVAPDNPVIMFLTQRDLHATSIANAFTQFGLPAARTDCPVVDGYPGYQWNLQNKTEENNQAPAPFQVQLTKEYLAFLPGHPDSGKPITREFPTYAALNQYREERRQAAKDAETRGASTTA